MRIVLVTAFPDDPESPRGGVEAVSTVLAGALARSRDLDVHVVTVRRGLRAAKTTRCGEVTVHALPRTGWTTLSSALGADRRQVLRRLEDLAPDLVHAHDTFGLMVRGAPHPRVLTIHGFIHGDTLVSGQRLSALRARLWRSAEHRTWADYPHVIAISPYVRERLAGVATGMVHDIDNPIDARAFDVPRREEPGTIFSAAVISRRKNAIALVEALALLRKSGTDARLRLAGTVVEPAYERALRARVRALGLAASVDLLGPLSAQGIRDELASAAVFALASREENSPIAIEEAMAAGVPVVASNRCGMPYMVRDGESGCLVDPEEPADIAAGLASVLRDRFLRASMGRRGRAVALDRFHPDAVARRTCAVYSRLLGRHVAGPLSDATVTVPAFAGGS